MSLKIVAWPGLKERFVNPYTWLLYGPMVASGVEVSEFSFYRPLGAPADVLHVHWPEGIFWNRFSRTVPWLAALYAERLLLAAASVKARGGCLVWTSHNLHPHEPLHPTHERIWQSFFPRFRSMADLIICLTAEAESLLRQAYPDLEGASFAIVPHPHYRSAYPAPLPLGEARALLGMAPGDLLVCCLGAIRPSKGIGELAACFSQVALPDERLLIAGACDEPAYRAKLIALANAKPASIHLILGRVSDQDIARLLSAADLQILNFHHILNSGSALLALSFDTPIGTPASGSLREFARLLGEEWVMTLPQPLSAAPLRALLDRAKAAAIGRRGQRAPLPADWEPEAVARRTLDAYERVLRQRRSHEQRASCAESAGGI